MRHSRNRFCLRRPLINPSGRNLGRSSDADFHPRSVSQIDHVIDKAIGLGPIGFTTSTRIEMALFGTDDTTVTGG